METAKALEGKRVCIVGGGNAAQTMAALFPHMGIECDLYAPFADEAQKLIEAIEEQGFIEARFAPHNSPSGVVRGRPSKISAEAKEVIPDADIILLPLPAFVYENLFGQIGPYLKKGALVGVTPGQGGVEWAARRFLGDADYTLFSIMPMPFNCRVAEFGKLVEVQTFKTHYRVGVMPAHKEAEVAGIVTALFGETEGCGHTLASGLYPINAVIHPARLYSLCKDWEPGQPLAENQRFT